MVTPVMSSFRQQASPHLLVNRVLKNSCESMAVDATKHAICLFLIKIQLSLGPGKV